MKEHPILFSGPMVRAILDGRKTMTRRVVKLRDPSETYSQFEDVVSWDSWPVDADEYGQWHRSPCPYGSSGDRLWVRETWAHTTDYDGQFLMDGVKALYRADNNGSVIPSRWRPSIHMSRWASRITLEVKAVRVERLQEITEADAQAEGVDRLVLSPSQLHGVPVHPLTSHYREAFSVLWDSINAKRGFGWDTNPWVWVISFERVK